MSNPFAARIHRTAEVHGFLLAAPAGMGGSAQPEEQAVIDFARDLDMPLLTEIKRRLDQAYDGEPGYFRARINSLNSFIDAELRLRGVEVAE